MVLCPRPCEFGPLKAVLWTALPQASPQGPPPQKEEKRGPGSEKGLAQQGENFKKSLPPTVPAAHDSSPYRGRTPHAERCPQGSGRRRATRADPRGRSGLFAIWAIHLVSFKYLYYLAALASWRPQLHFFGVPITVSCRRTSVSCARETQVGHGGPGRRSALGRGQQAYAELWRRRRQPWGRMPAGRQRSWARGRSRHPRSLTFTNILNSSIRLLNIYNNCTDVYNNIYII